MPNRLPTFYLSHGGGPWPYMTGSFRHQFDALEESLKNVPSQIRDKPTAILVVSAHWEERDFAVMASPAPPMVYDFGGFPPETYKIRYPAPGAPGLAEHIGSLVEKAGLPTHLDQDRGFDHGTYALLAVMYPDASIPVLQVSIRADYDPKAHLEMGRALAPLRDEGVLIIGSGSSYHDLPALMGRGSKSPGRHSGEFDAWLAETVVDVSPAQRIQRLLDWESAPSARAAHPREDHLMPLHVAVAAAEFEAGRPIFRQSDFFGSISMSSYRFGS